MNREKLLPALYQAIQSEDIKCVRKLIGEHRQLLDDESWFPNYLHGSAQNNKLLSFKALVDLGGDINAKYLCEEPIYTAAVHGAYETVKWLLEHGANLNHEVNGVLDCRVLDAAAVNSHLEIVKLLVESGAAINGAHPEHNALSLAMTHGNDQIVQYLRSKGAMTPWELRGEPPPRPPSREAGSILGYVEYHLGSVEPLSLQEIVSGSPPITIHVVRSEDEIVLVTDGMSSLPMTVPEGSEKFQFAELVMRLPAGWPLDSESLNWPENLWPIEWLRRIARHPHENKTWLGGQTFVFRNGEPPAPFAPNTKLSCLLGIAPDNALGEYGRSDGTVVLFYSLYPIYAEEAELEKRKGVGHLLNLFMKHEILPQCDLRRLNVALKSSRADE